jgi:hypothetical protein
VVFSQEQTITRQTPEAIIHAVRYAPTEQQIQWRHESVMSLGQQGEFVKVGKFA